MSNCQPRYLREEFNQHVNSHQIGTLEHTFLVVVAANAHGFADLTGRVEVVAAISVRLALSDFNHFLGRYRAGQNTGEEEESRQKSGQTKRQHGCWYAREASTMKAKGWEVLSEGLDRIPTDGLEQASLYIADTLAFPSIRLHILSCSSLVISRVYKAL